MRLRVLFPTWVLTERKLGRLRAELKPLAAFHDLDVIYFKGEEPEDQWATFTQVPPVGDLNSLAQLMKAAMKTITKIGDFDVLYTFSGGPHFQLLDIMIAAMAKKPAVMRMNGDGAFVRKHLFSHQEKIHQDAIDDLTLNNFDLIIPVSSGLREMALGRVKDKSRIAKEIPISVDLENFTVEPQPDELTLGYGGRLSVEKGMDFLQKLMNATPETRYRIAGHLQMRDFRFPDNCHYIGELLQEEMPTFYPRVSIVILTSYTEGCPNMLLEAYAAGRPVMVTPQAHPPELPVFGWEIPHDVDQWHKAIKNIDIAECHALGLKARKWISNEWPSQQDVGEYLSKKIVEVS